MPRFISATNLLALMALFVFSGPVLADEVHHHFKQVSSTDGNSTPNASPSATGPSPSANGQPNPKTGGPGTEMTRIINRMGMGSSCSRCKALAAEMDQRGVEWVKQNRDYVVRKTISNAEKLGHRMGPAQRAGVRMLVDKAIKRSE